MGLALEVLQLFAPLRIVQGQGWNPFYSRGEQRVRSSPREGAHISDGMPCSNQVDPISRLYSLLYAVLI